uniref:Gustatory receptor n=2 Tax=Panagrolaimus sp. PS1159 TaxID=55785 RepID=A0AC35FKA9_9BILA
MFVLTWSIQSSFSMGFLIYWQFNGYINDLFNCLYMTPKIYKSTQPKISKAIIFAIFISTTAIINYFAAVLLYYFYPYLSTIDLESLNTFRQPFLFPFSLGFLVYGFFIWNVVLTFYVIVSIVAYAKLNEFNEELKNIGKKDHHTDVIRFELMQMFMKHIENGKMIRTIDNTFEVYTFIMIGTNIPTTVFSLLSFFKALSDEWFIIIIIGPAIFFCLVELFNLTAVPAMLHQAINQVEKLIYRNSCIWDPYDEKIYQIALTLVTHVRQANLGISLWGFAVVSKPLILTTISLITTYLALILQLHPTVIQRVNGSVS